MNLSRKNPPQRADVESDVVQQRDDNRFLVLTQLAPEFWGKETNGNFEPRS